MRTLPQPHPGDDREEGEGNDTSGSVGQDLFVCRLGPQARQDAEADEPQERPHRCQVFTGEKHVSSVNFKYHFLIYGTVPSLNYVVKKWKPTLTRESKITYYNVFSVFGIADVREVGI